MADQSSKQPNQQQPASLPETLTVGGQTFSVKDTPELQAFIGQVSKFEKAKLYSRYSELESQIKALQGVQVEVTPQNLKEEIISEISKMIEPLLKTTNQIQTDTIEDYRKKLIAENEGKCIPELVKGDTKEALDASLRESIELRSKYSPAAQSTSGKTTDPLIAQQNQELSNKTAAQENTSAAQQSSSTVSQNESIQVPRIPVVQEQQTNIASMSQEDFAKNRESLFEGLKSLV